ncbi:MAG: replicative DNA helicase [Deltaproteobacteria bacterium]|nr:replicative DNA helicase [Deltaproteobacteria bacterium]
MAFREKKKELFHKVPPHHIEAELALLGAVLIEKDVIDKVLDVISYDGEDFYSDVHRTIFKGMVSLHEKHSPIDIITLTNLFKGSSVFDSVGGVSYIAEIVDATPTAANVGHYARIVKEKALLRRLINAATGIITDCYEGAESVEEFVDEAERRIFEVSRDRAKKDVFAIKDILKDTFATIESLSERKSHITGVPTGFKDIDMLTAGFQASDLIIVAGRPSMGKTAFCLNIAEHVAVEEMLPVVVFSLEMSKEQLVQRMLASRARVELGSIRRGALKDADWGRITTAAGKLHDAPIYIDDTAAQTVLDIRSRARRLKAEKGIGLVIVDYLQLMRSKSSMESREQEIANISRSLKAIAKELNIPIVALSQLSRRAEHREEKRPQLSDLRESGAIEQDADVVMFIYRESVYKDCDCPKNHCTCGKRGKAEIIVAKQRNGPTDMVPLTFLREYTRFADQARVDSADIHGTWVEE